MRSLAKLNRQERGGIFFLLLIIVSLQLAYVLIDALYAHTKPTVFAENKEVQTAIDAMKEEVARADLPKVYPFNPNFITDYKGYVLGMGIAEIDRLHAYRAQGNFVDSAEEFQSITKISDSLLAIIAPHFKFPEWSKSQNSTGRRKSRFQSSESGSPIARQGSRSVVVQDLNAVTAAELRVIKGIGEVLSKRIIKFRNRLGGFLVEEQVYDVYGLPPEVGQQVLKRYKVLDPPQVTPININEASVGQLASIAYISYGLAQRIVSFRETNGPFSNFDELARIDRFPADKIPRLALYLSL